MKPRVLILDDALSHVDVDTEAAILAGLDAALGSATVLLVANCGQPPPGRAGGAAGPRPGGRPGRPRRAGRPRTRLPGRARPRHCMASTAWSRRRHREPAWTPLAGWWGDGPGAGGVGPDLGAPPDLEGGRRSGRQARAWLWPLVRPHRRLVALASAAVLVQTGAGLAMPYLVKVAIDQGVVPRDLEVINRVALAYLVLAAVQFVASRSEIEAVAPAGQRVLFTVRTRLFRHLQTLSLDFYERERTAGWSPA